MLKRALVFLMTVALLAGMVSVTAFAGSTVSYRYVNTANHKSLNLREEPSTDAAVLTTIPYGAKIELIDYFVGSIWANVIYDGYYGYAQVRFMSMNKPSGDTPVTPAPVTSNIYDGFKAAYYVAQVTPRTPTGYVNMRWAPSKSLPIMTNYHNGSTLVVLYENGSWCQVWDESAHVAGYMMKEFLNYLYPWGGVVVGDGIAQ